MRMRTFSSRRVFLIALGVGLAVALAPMAVEAANRVVRIAGKKNRVVAVTKRGELRVRATNGAAVRVPGGVAVTNQPYVRVPDGVAVTNQPSVRVPDGVAVTNQPTVTVANPQTDVSVHSSRGDLKADSRPSLDGVFNMNGSRLGLGYINLLQLAGSERAGITEMTITGEGPAGSQVALIEAFVRTSGSDGCNGAGTPGYTRHTLRRVGFENGRTIDLEFDGAPLVPPQGGDKVCFGVTVISIPSGSATYAGGTGFRE
jgi:hypothetical protein